MKPLKFLYVMFASAVLICAQDSQANQVPSLVSPAEDTVKLSVREARGRSFKVRTPYSMIDPDPSGAGEPFTILKFRNQSELPHDDADTVIVGEVTRVQPFLTPDRKGIYNEYTLKVLDTIKNRLPVIVSNGDSLTILRQGGSARLPDGCVVKHSIRNDVTPTIGRQYLFF